MDRGCVVFPLVYEQGSSRYSSGAPFPGTQITLIMVWSRTVDSYPTSLLASSNAFLGIHLPAIPYCVVYTMAASRFVNKWGHGDNPATAGASRELSWWALFSSACLPPSSDKARAAWHVKSSRRRCMNKRDELFIFFCCCLFSTTRQAMESSDRFLGSGSSSFVMA